jgi:hypothetical protein
VKEFNIKDKNIYNADEIGWRIRCLNRRIIFMFPNVSAIYMSSLETQEFITIIKCISATSSYIPGFLILPSILLINRQFNNNIYPNYIFKTNKETGSGFINNILAIN